MLFPPDELSVFVRDATVQPGDWLLPAAPARFKEPRGCTKLQARVNVAGTHSLPNRALLPLDQAHHPEHEPQLQTVAVKYLGLTPGERALLHRVLLRIRRVRRPASQRPGCHLSRRLNMRVTTRQLAALVDAGFIEIVDVPADRQPWSIKPWRMTSEPLYRRLSFPPARRGREALSRPRSRSCRSPRRNALNEVDDAATGRICRLVPSVASDPTELAQTAGGVELGLARTGAGDPISGGAPGLARAENTRRPKSAAGARAHKARQRWRVGANPNVSDPIGRTQESRLSHAGRFVFRRSRLDPHLTGGRPDIRLMRKAEPSWF